MNVREINKIVDEAIKYDCNTTVVENGVIVRSNYCENDIVLVTSYEEFIEFVRTPNECD